LDKNHNINAKRACFHYTQLLFFLAFFASTEARMAAQKIKQEALKK